MLKIKERKKEVNRNLSVNNNEKRNEIELF